MQETTGNSKSARKKPVRKKKGALFILIFFVAVTGFMFFNRQGPVNTVDCTPEIIASKPDVVMLGAWWCTYCYKAKQYFQRNKISYCEYDMENTEEGKRLYEENGGGAVPILLIGQYQLKGYSEQQIEQALSRLPKNADKPQTVQKK